MRALLAAVLIAIAALAQVEGRAADDGSRRARQGVESGQFRPLGEVLANVTRAYPGRVVDVSLTGSVYRIKLLTRSGQVLLVSADARSGRILGVR
jgi:uncharacterized membrane protein YkoI